MMHLADEFPDFTSETVTLHGFKALVKAVSDPVDAQVFNLKAQIGLDPVLRFDLLNGLE